jgi:hypothetical protein
MGRVLRLVYEVNIFEKGAPIWTERVYLRIEAGDEPVDLTRLEPLTADEVEAIVNPPLPVMEVEPAAPLRRIARTPGDSASRLGFHVGGQSDIRFTSGWVWHAWHLP